jgi:hypothetical protein
MLKTKLKRLHAAVSVVLALPEQVPTIHARPSPSSMSP